MSETMIFVIGMLVFAITVYGVVIAGGVALSRIEIEQDPDHKKKVDKEELSKRPPVSSQVLNHINSGDGSATLPSPREPASHDRAHHS